mgnify:CR=1 FL=1
MVDFDVHHGNGTEEIARAWHAAKRRKRARAASTSSNDADLLFASIHLADDGAGSGIEFYPGTGVADGLHDNVVNVCVPPMWSGNAGSGRAKQSPVGTRARVSVKRNRDDDLDGGGAACGDGDATTSTAVRKIMRTRVLRRVSSHLFASSARYNGMSASAAAA